MHLLDSELSYSYRVNTSAKQLPNFSDYIILPNEGLIWSKKSGRFIGSKIKTGYYNATLRDDNGRQICGKLHRFIYKAVNGPIPDDMQVNHIDEDKSNNGIHNLNLMTAKENINWGSHNERMAKTKTNGSKSKPVGAFKDGELVMRFPSTMEAGRNGFNQGNVASCCRGERQSYKGYEWRYL